MNILLVEDEKITRITLGDVLRKEGHTVQSCENGDQGLAAVNSQVFELVVTDLRLPGAGGIDILRAAKQRSPGTVVVVMTAYGTVDTAVEALKMGAYDYLTKPFSPDRLLSMLEHITSFQQVVDENKQLRQRIESFESKVIVGESPVIRKMMDTVRMIAARDYTVLIKGESGTGKELVARALHQCSPRKDAPFVTLNCAALPESLLENELFGHEKGAFTGAVRKHDGYFERASGGTVFIDEIDDFPLTLQPKLLRVLQEKEIVRVGGSSSIPVDVRIIGATKVDLLDLVNSGRFRADLFYRLNIIPLTIPPLRDRKDDVVPLVTHFFQKHGGKDMLHDVSSDLFARLRSYDWPGNVRELENLIERVIALAGTVSMEELVADMMAGATQSVPSKHTPDEEQYCSYEMFMGRKEREIIEWAMKNAEGNVTAAAKLLDLPRSTLRSKLDKGYAGVEPGE
jgi:DNA-binding NtrC family response regulator